MANSDAWHAPDGSVFVRRRAGQKGGPRGHARLIAEPAYRRLLAAEPLLKRSIPTLIIIFLVVVAAVRFLSLLNWHDDIERNAKAMLALSAGELVNGHDAAAGRERRASSRQAAMSSSAPSSRRMGGRFALAITEATSRSSPPRARRRVAGQVARRADPVGPAAVHVRRTGRRDGRHDRRRSTGTRRSTSPTSARGRRRADPEAATCSPTGGARFRSTSRCSCSPRRSC